MPTRRLRIASDPGEATAAAAHRKEAVYGPAGRRADGGVSGPAPPPPAPGPVSGPAPPGQTGPAASPQAKSRRPPPPGPVVMTKDSEQQRYLASLQCSVSAGRWRSLALAVGLAAVLLLSLISWFTYYTSTVLSYAKVDPDVRIARNPHDPERLVLYYRPRSAGNVGFRRATENRETELLDRVLADSGDREETFEWRCRGVQVGDQLKVTFRGGWTLVTRKLSVPQAPPVPALGDAILGGEIVDAMNNQPLPGVDVRIVGTHLATVTDASGRFRLAAAPSGPVAVELSANNFSTEQLEKELVSGRETVLRVAMSPGMKAGQIRVVLTWNEDPADLDAHLEGPLPNEERFHIYFQEKGDLNSKQFVNLDVDDRDGQGPETITVLGVLPGTYHYFVHDYTNRQDAQNTVLSHSGGEVKVYQGGQTYRFHTNSRSIGNVWHVCDIVVSDTGASVRKIDEYETKQMQEAQAGTVILAIDVSGSMEDLIETTKQACYAFLDAVPFDSGARAGLVTYSGSSANKIHATTADRESLRQAIQPLSAGGGTPMDQGLEAAFELLRDVPGARTIVLFTDGKPDGEASTLAQAARIKNEGVSIWAIGTAGADMRLLRQLVSSPDKAFLGCPG